MSLTLPLKVPRKVKPADLRVYDFNRKEIGGPKTGGLYVAKPTVATFLGKQEKEAFYQAPLEAFKAWYEDFPFSEFVNSHEKAKVGWEYRVIFLFPAIQPEAQGKGNLKDKAALVESVASRGNPSGKRKPKFKEVAKPDEDKNTVDDFMWANTLLYDFYQKHGTLKIDKHRREMSVTQDVSIMIVCLPKGKSDASPLPSWRDNKNVSVISGITFRPGTEGESCKALIKWLSVSDSKETNLLKDNWRRHGVGTFMVVLVIKLCVIAGRHVATKKQTDSQAVTFDAKKEVELFAQSTDETQACFLRSCGFIHINQIQPDPNSGKVFAYDGHHQLPDSLRTQVEGKDETAFILNRGRTDVRGYTITVPALNQLPPGAFSLRPKYAKPEREVVEVDDDDSPQPTASSEEDEVTNWCTYPPSARGQLTKDQRLTEDDVQTLFDNTKLVASSFRMPLKGPLLLPGSISCRGEMTHKRRVLHTSKTYMSTGEMDMMLALLLCDGRYENDVSIIPCTYVTAISEAYLAHEQFTKVVKGIKELNGNAVMPIVTHMLKKLA